MRPRGSRAPAAALALAASLLPLGCATAGPGGAAAGPGEEPGEGSVACPPTPGQTVLVLANQERQRQGLLLLETDLRLVEAATRHARDLAEHGLDSHEGSDGSTPAERVTDTGYPWNALGENVATGTSGVGAGAGSGGIRDPGTAFDAWMSSPPHRDNLLGPRFVHVGFARARSADGPPVDAWVAVFGAGPAVPRRPPEGCHP